MASDARIPMFCEPDAEVRNKGRQDMLTHLLEVAPPGYEDAIEHESRRFGSLEDTAFIDRLQEECDDRFAEE